MCFMGLAPRGGPEQIPPLPTASGAGDAELRRIPRVAGIGTRKGSSPGVVPVRGPVTKTLLVITDW